MKKERVQYRCLKGVKEREKLTEGRMKMKKKSEIRKKLKEKRSNKIEKEN